MSYLTTITADTFINPAARQSFYNDLSSKSVAAQKALLRTAMTVLEGASRDVSEKVSALMQGKQQADANQQQQIPHESASSSSSDSSYPQDKRSYDVVTAEYKKCETLLSKLEKSEESKDSKEIEKRCLNVCAAITLVFAAIYACIKFKAS